MKKTTALKNLIASRELSFLMEAHNGLSARIVEQTGFEGIWASGLTISSTMGLRDSNEASYTQVLEILELMSDVTTIPILVDGDTGYGNFNNMRRFVKKLEQRNIAGICIEDKLFPKMNSFIHGEKQLLADVEEFCGKIKAGKDSRRDSDFQIVARVEALIAGWGLAEALKRASAYREAGADAILIHSKLSRADEIVAFMNEWGNRAPVVIVPTKYYQTPTEVFKKAGVSTVIWANHLCRSSILAMQKTAEQIFKDQNLHQVEDSIAPLSEVFRLQGAEELEEAEKKYLPRNGNNNRAVILAATRGEELGALTADRPKTMLPIASGKPILHQLIGTFNELGIKNITVVRGYKKEAVQAPNIKTVDNDDYEATQLVYSLYLAREQLAGPTLVSYGDVLLKKYIPMSLMEEKGDIVVAAEAVWNQSERPGRYREFIACDQPYCRERLQQHVLMRDIGTDLPKDKICGEWLGLFKVSETGAGILRTVLEDLSKRPRFRLMRSADLFKELIVRDHKINVVYTVGHWLDINTLVDLSQASSFS